MSPRKKLIIAAAACGACCAAPLLLVPALAALGVTGVGVLLAEWGRWIDYAATGAVALIAGLAVRYWMRSRRRARGSCRVPPHRPGPAGSGSAP